MSNGELNFNPSKKGCNAIFNFGDFWTCWKVLVVEYQYGNGP